MRALCLALLLVLGPVGRAPAEEVVLGLSQDEIAITSGFDGSQILIFGAVKREVPVPDGPPLEVIITVEGPDQSVQVRRKARRWGIWVNAAAVRIDRVPSFYAVASTRPISAILSETDDLRYRITLPRAMRTVGAANDAPDVANFTEALLRIRTRADLYQRLEGSVRLDQSTLFRTRIDLPTNLVEGAYDARIFLLRGQAVLNVTETAIEVRKVGLEEFLHTMAHETPLLYGILSLVIAVVAGWGASAAFRAFQR